MLLLAVDLRTEAEEYNCTHTPKCLTQQALSLVSTLKTASDPKHPLQDKQKTATYALNPASTGEATVQFYQQPYFLKKIAKL